MERGSETDEETRRLSAGAGSGDGGNGGGGRRREGEGRGVRIQRGPRWPTIDGQLGLSEEESVVYARKYFRWGFFLLPFFWALNCFYFWPVLRHPSSFPRLRPCMLPFCLFFFFFFLLFRDILFLGVDNILFDFEIERYYVLILLVVREHRCCLQLCIWVTCIPCLGFGLVSNVLLEDSITFDRLNCGLYMWTSC